MTAQATFQVVRDYWYGMIEGDRARARALLADDVVFEGPEVGLVRGADAHLALSGVERRFPGLQGFAPRAESYSADDGFRAYEVYTDGRAPETVIDQFRVVDGKIAHVLSVRGPSQRRAWSG